VVDLITHLTATANSGTSILTVDAPSVLSPTGGTLVLDETPLTYTSVNGTVNLSAALGATYEAGLPVRVPDMATYWVQVQPDDPEAGAITAILPTDMTGWFSEGVLDPAAPVELELVGSQWRVLRRLDSAAEFDGSVIDPATIPTGQAFSTDAPVDTDGYPEGYGWWQVVDGEVVGFWRLVAGVWTSQTIVTQEALQAGNILAGAINATDLTGVNINGVTITGADVTGTNTITGALYRTRLTGDRVAIGPLVTNPDYTSVRFEADNTATLTPPALSGTDNTSQDATLLLDTGERAAVALPLGRTKRAWLQLLGQSVSGANTTRATVAANEILLRGHTSSTTVVTIDGAMGNGSVGAGTFRDSIDARVVGSDTWHTVTSFSNTWTDRGAAGHPPVSYRKYGNGDVRLRGHLSVGGASGTVAFSLPSGWRPDFEIGRIPLGASQLGTPAYLDVLANGNCEIRYPAGTTYVSLNGVSFSSA
jgi:hypothetical protein